MREEYVVTALNGRYQTQTSAENHRWASGAIATRYTAPVRVFTEDDLLHVQSFTCFEKTLTPRDVEIALELHDDVVLAFVCGVPVEDNMEKVVAAVALSPGATVTEDELKAYVKKNLASFKAPKEVVFLDELPRNATGKILKRSLVVSLD